MSYLSDKEIDELGKKVVSDLYNNKDIINMKNNGKPLVGHLKVLIDRNISGIYSNITNFRSVQNVLTNAIRYSIFIEKDLETEKQIKLLRDEYESRKNTINNTNNNKKLSEDDLNTLTEEIELLEGEIKELEEKVYEPPEYRKNIIDTAQRAYKLMLRNDKSAEKLYSNICDKLGVKLDNNHFGYYNTQYRDKSDYRSDYRSDNRNSDTYRPRNFTRNEDKKDVYVPPALKYKKY